MFQKNRSSAFIASLGLTLGALAAPPSEFAGTALALQAKPDADCCKVEDKPKVDINKFFDALKTFKLEVLKDGKHDKNFDDVVTIAEIIKKNGDKPTFVLSMGAVCPHAIKAQNFYNVLFDAINEFAVPVIVFNGTVEQAREFKNKTSLTALIVCDPKCQVSFEASPLERSSTSVIFIMGRPQVIPEGVANENLTNLSLPCSEAGFKFAIQSVVTDKNRRETIWKQVDEKIGEDLRNLTYHYGCPSAPAQ